MAAFGFNVNADPMAFPEQSFCIVSEGSTSQADNYFMTGNEVMDTTSASFDLPGQQQLFQMPSADASFGMPQSLPMDNTLEAATWNTQLTPNTISDFSMTPSQSFGSIHQLRSLNSMGKRPLALDAQDIPQPKRHESYSYGTTFSPFTQSPPMSLSASSWKMGTSTSSIDVVGLSDEAADVCALWFSKYSILPSDRHIESLAQLTGESSVAIRQWFGRMLQQGLINHDSAYKSQTSFSSQPNQSPPEMTFSYTTLDTAAYEQDTTITANNTTSEPARGGKKGCVPTNDPELLNHDPTKIYQCTRKCGKRYARKCDWKRNEEESYPSRSWLCSLCVRNGTNEKLKPCFRRYHFSQHFRNIHPEENDKDYEASSLVQSDTRFPRRCGFCPHRFVSRQDRIDHIAEHFKSGKCMLDWVDYDEDNQGYGGTDDDDDDKHDDGSSNDNGPSKGFGSGAGSSSGSKRNPGGDNGGSGHASFSPFGQFQLPNFKNNSGQDAPRDSYIDSQQQPWADSTCEDADKDARAQSSGASLSVAAPAYIDKSTTRPNQPCSLGLNATLASNESRGQASDAELFSPTKPERSPASALEQGVPCNHVSGHDKTTTSNEHAVARNAFSTALNANGHGSTTPLEREDLANLCTIFSQDDNGDDQLPDPHTNKSSRIAEPLNDVHDPTSREEIVSLSQNNEVYSQNAGDNQIDASVLTTMKAPSKISTRLASPSPTPRLHVCIAEATSLVLGSGNCARNSQEDYKTILNSCNWHEISASSVDAAKKSESFLSVKLLGTGGFSTVDEVVHRETNLRVSRKTLKNRDLSALSELKKEVQVLKRLRHPHIIRFLGAYSKGDKLSILLSPVAETTLAIWLQKSLIDKPLGLARMISQMLGCLCSTVRYLHEQRPVVKHMDIKPQNILIVISGHETPHVILSDFGTSSSDEQPTADRSQPITRQYCAPEVSSGIARGRAADIWSLGCVFLEMIASSSSQEDPKWLDFLKEFSGREGKCYWQEVSRLHGMLATFVERAMNATDANVVRTVKSMVNPNPAERPNAAALTMVFTPSSCCLSWPNENAAFPGPREEATTVETLIREDGIDCLEEPQKCAYSHHKQEHAPLARAKTWLNECIHDHEACVWPTVGARKLPTRLLDIRPKQVDGPSVRVVNSADIDSVSNGIEYVCISHVWSPSDLTLSQNNIEHMRNGFFRHALPKALNDAITAAEQTGFRYLWMDSLCVLQDTTEDKQRECANMASIYRDATMTIVADDIGTIDPWRGEAGTSTSQAASTDHAASLNNNNDDPRRTATRHTLSFADRTAPAFAWDTRAWNLQERLLSRRLLHLAGAQMYWECNGLKASETFPHGLPCLVWEKAHMRSATSEHAGVEPRTALLGARPYVKKEGDCGTVPGGIVPRSETEVSDVESGQKGGVSGTHGRDKSEDSQRTTASSLGDVSAQHNAGVSKTCHE